MEIVLILGIGLFFFATMIVALLYYDYKIKELSSREDQKCLEETYENGEYNCEYENCTGCKYCCGNKNEQLKSSKELPKIKSKEEKLNDDIKEIDLITEKLMPKIP